MTRTAEMGDRFSALATDSYGRAVPERARLAGYAALVDRYALKVPLPARLSAIAERHQPTSTNEWQLLSPRHAPDDTLLGHLEFALKWEGIDLGVLAGQIGRASCRER